MAGCQAAGVYFEDVTVDTLRLPALHMLGGCVFKHVILRGKIGPLMTIPPNSMSPNESELTAGVVAKYEDVDWALDISEAVFSDADFYYVPGELIRRDENTQGLLRREAFRDIDWRGLPGYVGFWVRRFGSTAFDSIVAIARRALKKSSQRPWRALSGSMARALPDSGSGLPDIGEAGSGEQLAICLLASPATVPGTRF
jgi:hypothetical protein